MSDGLSHGVWPLVGAATMRALDRHTIETLGVPGDVLMESAGRAVAELVLADPWSDGRLDPAFRRRPPVIVVCGSGNNGGDGLVAARHLHAVGVEARVVLLGDPDRLSGDAATNYDRAVAFGVPISAPPFEIPESALIVDAIFGTGLDREVKGAAAGAIEQINRRGPGCRVLSVDVPSGLDADRGRVMGVAVRADTTLSIGLPKLGLVFEPGRSHAGDIEVARIGIADEAPGVSPEAELWSETAAGALLPARPADGHKGRFGHLLVIAGSEGKTGAAALAARAAVRGGAGLVTIACPAGLNDILERKCTEPMTAPVADTPERCFALAAEAQLLELAKARDVVALGPGIGTHDETSELVRRLCAALERPLVLDADGLNAFAGAAAELRARPAATLLTPHPGEAARLLGVPTGEISADPLGAARELAERTGATVLLKGGPSVIVAPGARALVNPTGGPALASGGTGDVLTGLVGALWAQGCGARVAAGLGAYLHGLAARFAPGGVGGPGLRAEELADHLGLAFQALRTLHAYAEERGRGRAEQRLRVPFPDLLAPLGVDDVEDADDDA